MTALSGKTLALGLAGIIGWLIFGAILQAMGVAASLLLLLNLGAVAALIGLIARKTIIHEAQAFLSPFREGPTVLTPPGVAIEWLSGFGTIGTVALMIILGIDGFAVVLGMIGGLVLSSILVAPALAASGATTLPGWVRWRFGERGRWGAMVLFAVFGVLVMWIQFAFAALVAQAVFGLPALIGVLAVSLLVLLSVMAGGMGTVVAVQAVLFAMLCAGVLIPAVWLGVSQAGILLPWFAPGALLHEIAVAEARLDIADGFMAHDPLRAMMLGLTGLFGAMALPHTLTRWPVERSADDAGYFAQRAVVMAVVVVMALPLFAIATRALVLLPAMATLTTPDILATPTMAFATAVRTLDPPAWLLAALGTGALVAVVASASSAAVLVAGSMVRGNSPETAGGMLMRLRWIATIAIAIAAFLALTVTVDPVAAFLVVMILAASMLFAPLTFGLFWQRTTVAGAAAGVVIGGAVAIGSLILNEQNLLNGAFLIGVGASVLATVLVSLMSSPDPMSPLPLMSDQPPR